MRLSRRTLLASAGAAAIVPTMPSAASAAPLTAPSLPAFMVGTPGDFNWRVFFAANAERAKALWLLDAEYASEEEAGRLDVQDVPHLGLASEEGYHHPSVSDCIAMGWDNNCDRCYCDVSVEGDNYREIDGSCVCQECMTPQETDAEDHDDFLHWLINERYDITDLAVFALLRPADFLDETILEVLADEAELHPTCAHLAPFARLPEVSIAPTKKDT